MSDRENQALIGDKNDIIPINNFFYNVCKSICKIIGKSIIATGFLIKLHRLDEPFYCLMTNKHVITNDMIENEEEIDIYYDNQQRKKTIKLDKAERFIRDYMFLNIDAIVIEILDKDDINDYFYLLPNHDYLNNFDDLVEKVVCIIQFPKGGVLSHSKGEIVSITQYEFTHKSCTERGSSGSPIFLDGVPLVIGIHKQGRLDHTENYGDFIGPIIQSLNKDLEFVYKKLDNGVYEGEIHNNKKEGYGKYTINDGTYYIGQFLNGFRHGRGADYYRNNNIMHEGDFVNDQLDGKGKYYDKDGSYYIGQFSKGMKHGKGKDYYIDGNIQYDGEYVMGKRQGHGKYISKNGEYFIGQFWDGYINGKGTEFYKDGTIKYEGDFIKDEYEGKGKFFYEEGGYYIGDFSKGLQNGKGTEYTKNNTIEYEGDFANDEREGYGKYIWDNGDYYIGQFLKGHMHGKGKEYKKDNTLIYEGEYKNDLYDGKGKLFYENGKYYEGEFVEGLKHGKGILFYKDGKIKYDGQFEKGKFIKK